MSESKISVSLDLNSSQVESQTRQWDSVVELSRQITEEVVEANWSKVRQLADKRELLILDFFDQPVADAIYSRVIDDINHIQDQNYFIIDQLSQAQLRNEEKSAQLETVRENILQDKPDQSRKH